MQCNQLNRLIKDWYIHVTNETMAPGRMMQFIDQHVKECEDCRQESDIREEVEKIREFILPDSKLPKSFHSLHNKLTPEISPVVDTVADTVTPEISPVADTVAGTLTPEISPVVDTVADTVTIDDEGQDEDQDGSAPISGIDSQEEESKN